MATFRRSGKKWRAEVSIKGKRASKTFETKLAAKIWAVEQEKSFDQGASILKGKTVKDAFERYAREVSPTKRGARWEIIRLKKLSRQYFSTLELHNLRPDDVQDWININLKTLAPGSVKRELHLVSAVFEKAKKTWKWLEVNPCKDVEKPKDPRPRERRISQKEINQICGKLQYADDSPIINQYQEIAAAFLLAIETAMRQGELWSLTWDNVFLDQKYLILPITKNGHQRNVPLSSYAIDIFKKFSTENGDKVFSFNQQSCGAIFRRIVKSCSITNLTFHDTRHEALTRLARKIDVLDLARMVGHRDINSLLIYYNPTPEEIANRLG